MLAHPHHPSCSTPITYSGNRFAERFGDAWVVLSAKDGFIPPEFTIPAPYEV
jgi:hypothetical protein